MPRNVEYIFKEINPPKEISAGPNPNLKNRTYAPKKKNNNEKKRGPKPEGRIHVKLPCANLIQMPSNCEPSTDHAQKHGQTNDTCHGRKTATEDGGFGRRSEAARGAT